MNFLISLSFILSIFVSYWFEPFCIFLSFGLFFHFFQKENITTWQKCTFIFLMLLSWNVIVTYWLAYSHFLKAILTYFLNTFFYAIVVFGALWVQSKTNKNIGAFSLIIFWLSLEYLHHFWDFGWAWLTLGNVFASRPAYIQWYSFVGVLGGSAWILGIGFLINNTPHPLPLSEGEGRKRLFFKVLFCVFLIFLPFSFPKNKISKEKNAEIILAQLSPKFDKKDDNTKFDMLLPVLNKEITKNTRFVILPEIFFTKIWFSSFDTHLGHQKAKEITEKHPKLNFIIGSILHKKSTDTTQSQKDEKTNIYYKAYNSSIHITKDTSNIKIKKSLVPIAEFVPDYLTFIFGKSPYQKENLTTNIFENNSLKVSNFICYEAINSFLTIGQQANQKSNFIAMIASEGFFKDDFARQQYLDICRLRCIETNKYMLKSTYNGFASVIDHQGNILEKISPNDFKIKNVKIPLQENTTFYTKFYMVWFWILVFSNIFIFWKIFFFKKKSNIQSLQQ